MPAVIRFRFTLLMALAGLLCGLVPQLLVYFSLNFFNNYIALFVAIYAAFFLSLALVPPGAVLAGLHINARQPLPELRALLVLEAAGLSALWYRLLNPFPAGPLLQNGLYLPVLLTVMLLIAGWLFFLFILKKIL